MAKSLKLTQSGVQGDPALANQITLGEPVFGTLGSAVAAALDATTNALMAAVDFLTRKVRIFNSVENDMAEFDAALDAEYLGVLTMDEAGKKSAPWSFGGEAADATIENAIAAVVGAVKPNRSLASLISAIEDAIPAASQGDVFLVADQVSGQVRVYKVGETTAQADITAAAAAAGVTEQAEVEQTEEAAEPGQTFE